MGPAAVTLINEEREGFSRASPNRGPLRTVARIAMAIGAVGSLALMFRSIQRNPSRLLILIFVFWVLAPFAALAFADAMSTHWTPRLRRTLYSVMLLVALGSLGAYVADAVWPRKAQAAFVYVALPPASVLFSAIVVSAAGLLSRRQ
jgi:cation transport ATPase